MAPPGCCCGCLSRDGEEGQREVQSRIINNINSLLHCRAHHTKQQILRGLWGWTSSENLVLADILPCLR